MSLATQRRFFALRSAAVLAALLGGAVAATASSCLPPPVDCQELVGQPDVDCMTRCMECGDKDYGPCWAQCRSQVPPPQIGPDGFPDASPTDCDEAVRRRLGICVPPSKSDGGAMSLVVGDGGTAPSGHESRYPGTSFPPPAIEPPSKQSAKPGDGTWRRLGDPARSDRAATGAAVLVQTTLHPHPVSRFQTVVLVAIDLRHVRLHSAAGTDDPGLDGLSAQHPAGLVPERHRDRLLAVLNGGFLPKHGHWGMMIGGHVLLPPKEEACTIAMSRDGGVQIRSWPEIAPKASELAAYRQTPPCLLESSEIHPLLEARNERPWGGRDRKRKTRRRSALGIDATGRVLLYGFGEEVGARMLAIAMRQAGAVHAAQLDINWSWVKFLLMGQPDAGAPLQVTSTLVPKMVHSRNGYVERKAFRDFFYLTRR